MATNTVQLKSWETANLTASEMALRNKNLATQWLDANSTIAQSTGGSVVQTQPVQPVQAPTQQPVWQAPQIPQQTPQTQAIQQTEPIQTTTEVKAPTEQDITYSKDATPYNQNDVISSAQSFQWQDGKTYQTQRLNDNTLITVDTATGNPVTSRYTDEQRDTIKQSLVWQATTPDSLYQSFVAGIPVDKNTPWYASAKARYDSYSMYSSLSDAQLSSALWNGNILPWTTAYNDLIKDPIQKERLERIQQYNLITGNKSTTEDIFAKQSENIANNTQVTIDGQRMTLATALSDWYIDINEMNAMTNNSEVITKAKEVESLKNEYDSQLANYNSIKKQVEEQLKGTGATSLDMATAVANAQEKLLPWLQELESRTNNAIGTLTQLKADATSLFATNLELYQKQQAKADAQATLTEQRAYDEAQQTKALEQKYAYDYGDLNSENPTLQNIAIERAVAGMYTNYPIPWMESQATKVQKVKQLMAQGMSGTEAIAQVENEIRNSQRYKDYIVSEQAKTKDIWFTSFDNNLYKTDSQGNISLAIEGKEDVKEWKKLDDGTYVDPEGNIRTKSELDQEKLLSNKFLTMKAWENAGVECWVFASRGTGLTSTPGWNSLTDRITAFKDQEPVVWGMVLFSGGNYDPKYGHISIVTGVSADGNNITIKESNLKNDKSVTERTIPITEATGFYNDTPLAGGGKETGITDKQYTQYNQAYTAFRWNPLVKNFEEALSSGGDLISSLKSENWPWDVGAIFQFMKTLDPASVVRETEFAIAQNTSGLSGKFSNLYEKVINWDRLSDEQRKAFWKIAFEYIKNKGKSYDIKYDDFTKVLKNQWIPDSYYPTRMSDYITQFENPEATQTTTPAQIGWNTVTSSKGNTYTY